MANPFDPLDPSDALDEEDLLSEELSDAEEPRLLEERTTAAEMQRPRSIEDALDEEVPDMDVQPGADAVLVEFDEPDDEGQLVGDEAQPWDGQLSPEEDAVHTAMEAPGGTDHEDDGYGDDAG